MNDVEGIIQDIAFGGEGVLRAQAKAIFVPFTAPKDKGIFTIIKEKKKYSFGKIKTLLSQSPERVPPSCPVFEKCGGCQFQHLNYEMQLKIKEKFVKDALNRIAKIHFPILPIIPAPKQLDYREYITLHLRFINHKLSCGYIGHNPCEFIEINSCPIFCTVESPVFKKLQELLEKIPFFFFEKASIKLLKIDKNAYTATLFFSTSPPFSIKKILEDSLTDWAGIKLISPKENLSLGTDSLTFDFLGLSIETSSQNFLQNFREQSKALHSHILSLITPSINKVLDLYCGIGLTSLLLAKQGKEVIGVEWNKNAIHFAKENSKRNNIFPKFEEGSVENSLPRLLKTFNPECVILNPPRTGLDKKVIHALLKNCPKEIIYISCMPATLARDLAELKSFELTHVQPFDMFPQTTHVESVVKLKATFHN